MSLVCQPDGGNEPQADEELVWLRNDAVVSLKEGNKNSRSRVCVTPIIYEDNGAIFTCHLSKNATVRASVALNVTCESLQINVRMMLIMILLTYNLYIAFRFTEFLATPWDGNVSWTVCWSTALVHPEIFQQRMDRLQ